jgi:hypothetical protein
MKRILNFKSFINEAQIEIKDPSTDGEKFANILIQNKDAKEQPKGSNKGPEVSKFLASTGLGPGFPWCMAFVYYIFDELCKKLGSSNPLPKTAGVMNHWAKAPSENKIDIQDAKNKISLVRPGQIFIMGRPGKGLGHTGIVVSVDEKARTFTTLEGNTNDQQSGEGDRVGKNVRKIDSPVLKGFIDYFNKNRTPEFEEDLSKALTGEISKLSPLSGDDELPDNSTVGKGFGQVTQDDPSQKLMGKILGSLTGDKQSEKDLEKTLDDLR